MLGDVSLENPPESHFYTCVNREGGVVIVPCGDIRISSGKSDARLLADGTSGPVGTDDIGSG